MSEQEPRVAGLPDEEEPQVVSFSAIAFLLALLVLGMLLMLAMTNR